MSVRRFGFGSARAMGCNAAIANPTLHFIRHKRGDERAGGDAVYPRHRTPSSLDRQELRTRDRAMRCKELASCGPY